MTKKFRNKYRIASSHLQNWDYGWNARYFVTICTADKTCYFGDIQNEKMHLSEIGQYANDFWYEIPKHFSFVTLDEFVVMPNHVHGIIIISKKATFNKTKAGTMGYVETPNLGVSTTESSSIGAAKLKWKPGTLGVIINQYKRICTINARKTIPGFDWQSRYHDHIIRNDKSYQTIRDYIRNNPGNWKDDKFYTDN